MINDLLYRLFGVVLLLLTLASILLVGALIWVAVQDARAPKITLAKPDWACTSSHQASVTRYTLVAKVLVPRTTTETVCDQWSRR